MYYLYLCGYTIKSTIMYRLSTFIDTISAVLTFFIQLTLWQALLEGNSAENMTFAYMIPYIIIMYFSTTFTNINIATTIENSMRDGSILYYLIRPVNYKKYLLCQMLGQNTFKACANTLFIFIIASLLYGIYWTESIFFMLCFIVSLLLGMLLMFEITYTFGLLAFWLQRTWFIEWFLQAFTIFFGGSSVPLWFYPEALQNISLFLPFRYISYEAINMYLGRYSIEVCFKKFTIAFMWIIVLWILDYILWKAAQKRIEINGG